MATITYLVTNKNDSGPGSFRNGIETANQNKMGFTIITIMITGKIILESYLPDITERVQIDGSSNFPEATYPVFEIDRNRRSGLIIKGNANDSTVQKIGIFNSGGNGITLYSRYNKIFECYIYNNDDHGIYCSSTSSHNQIGSNPSLESSYVSNIISGNCGNGIFINNSTHNIIQKNIIGTNCSGYHAFPNGRNGILISGFVSMHNIIGEKVFETNKTSDGIINNDIQKKIIISHHGNLISGNKENGVCIEDDTFKNSVYGNFIGTNFDGTSEIKNGKKDICACSLNDNYINN